MDSLEDALGEGEITEKQYEALKARLVRERASKTSRLVARRLLWTGLILVAILIVYVSLIFLNQTERIAVLGAGLGTAFVIAVLVWRRPERKVLSRGLLGLTIFLFAILLLQLQAFPSISGWALLLALSLAALAGAIIGIWENSTWLATPSVVSFYVGFLGLGIAFTAFPAFIEDLFIVSMAIAALVTAILLAWSREKLQRTRDWYLRHEAAVGQLGRGHFVLFALFVFFALAILAPFGRSFILGGSNLTASLIPFGIAFAGLLYAWKTENRRLLTAASLLIILLAWLLVPLSGVVLWPIAIAVTAAILIYLGLRSKTPASSRHQGGTQESGEGSG